ncbi:glycosyltransferase family 2 protein [Sphingomonas sp.]|uniref:glycosyltransferase family 2 protein n=1 Tax=Sphingomonas sp. TaxID=28214 RepID=UPI003CC53000
MRASIITPTFNAVAHIDGCVENVRGQGDVVLEHIIVDGGSTDGTIERTEALQTAHPALRYIAGPDRGQSDALNKGVAAATGEIIGVLNVDDTYEPGAVAQAAAHLRRLQAPAFVVGNCRLIDVASSGWNVPKDLRFPALMLGYDYAQWPNNPAAYFYHRTVHQHVGEYDVGDHYAMDLDFIFRCARKVTMRHVHAHWGNFYLHPGSKTFDDADGPARQRALFDRFHAGLTDTERRDMDRIRAAKDRRLALKARLKHVGALRRLNELLFPVR